MNIRKLHSIGSASIAILLLFVCLTFPKNLVAQPAPPPIWEVPVTITSAEPDLQAEVIFGIDPAATDGFDRGIDAAGNLVPGGMEATPYLNAFFHGERIFRRDIRQDGPWKLVIQTNRACTLSWDVSEVPADVSITLDAGDGEPVIMEAGAEKELSAGDHEIIIKAGAQVAVSPENVGLGNEVTVTGEDFGAEEDISIMLGDKEVATATTDAAGAFEATFTVTTDNVPVEGDVIVKATGAEKEAESTLTYASPQITTVNAVVDGRDVVVTMEGGANGIATFSIDGVVDDVEMVEEPAGTYVGTYSPKGKVEGAAVTATLSDGLNPASTAVAPETVTVDMLLYEVSFGKGLNMISLPLADATVQLADGGFSETPITSLSTLFDALGGPDSVALIIYHDVAESKFNAFTNPNQAGSDVDIKIEGDTGLIVNMLEAKNVTFRGDAWPGTLDLNKGMNLIGLPLDGVGKLSDLVNESGGNITQVFFYDVASGGFSAYTEKAAEGAPELDIDITGDLGVIAMTKEAQTLTLIGEPWSNPPAVGAPPASVISPLNLTVTPVLVIDGTLIHEITGTALNGLSVTARNLSTGISLTDTTTGNGSFSLAFVSITNHAAKIGDVIEVNVVAQKGSFKVAPVQYTLTETDIELGKITLGNLIANVIPSRSELLSNFPNPFNPETWIPFKLAGAADATITVYDVYGHLVRTIELGQLHAGLYSTKAKAAYWDGTNAFGERVASGIYFYHLKAGEFSATRRMVILK